MSKNHYIIPVFVPDLGCPYRCVFCNQKRITGIDSVPTQEDVKNKIISYLRTMPDEPGITREVAFYGGSFTAVSLELQKELLSPAYNFLVEGKINSIRISTRPDALSEDILVLLSSYGVSTVELGVQSMDDEVLFKSGRGHTSRDVLRATALIKSWGMNLGYQIMVGLPGDTEEKDLDTASQLIALQPDMVRIYPCLVLKGTKLARLFEKGEYKPLTLNEAVASCTKLLIMFERAGINVIRIGLQPSEQINLEGDVITGPYHPAFRELVLSEAAKKQLEFLFVNKAGLNSAHELVIMVPEKDISFVRGHNGRNIMYFKHKYGIDKFSTVADSGMSRGTIRLVKADDQKLNYELKRTDLPLDT